MDYTPIPPHTEERLAKIRDLANEDNGDGKIDLDLMPQVLDQDIDVSAMSRLWW